MQIPHSFCIGFGERGFGSSRATGVASLRICEKLLLCSTETIPASSCMDPLLAKAKPISYGDSASGITYLWRGGKNLCDFSWGEEWDCKRSNSADPKVSAEEGGWGAPGAGAEIPLQSMEQTMVRQSVPCSLWRSSVQQISTWSPGRTPCWSGGMPEGGCDPMGSLAGAICYWRTAPHGRDPHWSTSWITAACEKDSLWSSSWGTVSCGREPHCSNGRVWGVSPLRRKEWWRQRVMNWAQLPFPAALEGEGRENRKWSSAWEEVRVERKMLLRFSFISYYLNLIGLVIN